MYQLGITDKLVGKPSCIIRLSDHTSIPINPDNTDYQAYLAWVALGNQPTPADEVTK
jgi:hypothetical protein